MTIHIISPAAATNLITNPSAELATTGYSTDSTGGALSQSATYAFFGAYAVRVVLGGSGTQNIKYTQSGMLTAATVYALTARLRKSDGSAIAGVSLKIDTITLTTTITNVGGGWYELNGTGTTAGSITAHTVEIAGLIASGTYYADGFDLKAGSTITTYCDGDQDGCEWSGVDHASTSTRSAMTRQGGQRVALADYMNLGQLLGVGTPPIHVISMPFGLTGGAQYQRSVRQPRAFSVIGTIEGSSVTNLHLLQRQLFDLLKPDLVTPQQPVRLEYTISGSGKRLWIDGAYDGGLEFETQKSNVMEKIGVRLIAHDPMWYEEQGSAAIPGFAQTINPTNYILQRTTGGTWQALGTGLNSLVYGMAYGPDGCLYVFGSFTTAGGITVNYVAKWNGSVWSALSTGLDGLAAAGAFDQAGNLYVIHAGTGRISKWNGSAWSVVGTGLDLASTFGTVSVDSSGNVYVGANFNTAGGVTCNNIAKWNGSAWSALGTGTNNSVYASVIGPDGYLYIGGSFTTAGGTTVNGVAKWNGSSWSALSGGMTAGFAQVEALAFGPDGLLYVGGVFTAAGGVSATNIAKWNGVTWSPLGSGVNLGVYAIQVDASGLVHVSGEFTSAGGLVSYYYANWNRSQWTLSDVVPTATSHAALVCNMGLFIGLDVGGSGSSTSSVLTSVTNGGSAEAHPKIKFTGPGTVVQLKNVTTGDSIWFSLTLLAGEIATLDLTPGAISFVSSFRGNIIGVVLPGSNLTTWKLLPGSNSIACFITGSDANTKVVMTWKNAHWSIDGIQ